MSGNQIGIAVAGAAGLAGRVGAGERVRAGQAARVRGGPQAASNRLSHSASRCQYAGRCRVRWRLPRRAVGAAMSIGSRRMVAPRALAWVAEARHPAARSRLPDMAASVSQAALAANFPNIWQVRQGTVGPVGEHLLHYGMIAVLGLGLEQPEGRVGEHRVVA